MNEVSEPNIFEATTPISENVFQHCIKAHGWQCLCTELESWLVEMLNTALNIVSEKSIAYSITSKHDIYACIDCVAHSQ